MAANSRHNDVGEQQVYRTSVSLTDALCFVGVAGGPDRVSVLAQDFSCECANLLIIFHKQDCLGTVQIQPPGARRSSSLGNLTVHGQVDPERSATVRLAVDANEASALFNNPIHRRET